MARKGKITPQQAKLLSGIAAGKTVKAAAIEAKICPTGNEESSRVEAYRMLRLPHVAAALDAALDKAGATVEASAKVIADAHGADKMAMDKFGESRDLGPDHAIRLKASELNLRARRLIGSGPEEGGGNQTVNLFAVLSAVKDARNDRGLPL